MNLLYSTYGITINTKINIHNLNMLFDKAVEKYVEDQLWEKWKLQYPFMTEENFINFEDYKEKYMPQNDVGHTDISYDDVEKEMDKIVKTYERRA